MLMFCANHRLNNSIRLASISRSEELDVSFFHYLQTRKRDRERERNRSVCFHLFQLFSMGRDALQQSKNANHTSLHQEEEEKEKENGI